MRIQRKIDYAKLITTYNQAIALGLFLIGLPIVSNAVEDRFRPADYFLKFDDGSREEVIVPIIGDINNDGLVDIFFYDRPDFGDTHVGMYWVANEGDKFPYGSREFEEQRFPLTGHIKIQNAENIGTVDNDFGRRTFLRDINGDGRLDVLVVMSDDHSGAEREIHAAINTGGSPRFLEPTLVSTVDASTFVQDLVDLDNDGDLDFVDTRSRVFLNEGSPGTFGPFSSPLFVGPQDSTYGRILAVGDINNDGYVDIIRSGSVTAQFLNNRTATPFTEDSEPLVVQNFVESRNQIELADLDGDGYRDMVTAGPGGAVYYMNAGAGELLTTAQAQNLGPAEASESMSLVDLNDDGFTDVFLCGGGMEKLYVNSGDSAPFAPSLVPAIGRISCSLIGPSVQTADIDSDGDIDLVYGGAYFLNNGFRQTPMPVLTVSNTQVFSDAGTMDVLIELNAALATPVSFEFATVGYTARPGKHYYGVFDEVTFLPGETRKIIPITILDGARPLYADFWLVFTGIDGANIADDVVRATIRPPLEDIIPELKVPNASAVESNGRITFGMSLSSVTSRTVSVSLETVALANGATPGEDYYSRAQTIEFQPNERIKFFTVDLVSDVIAEDDEQFALRVTAIENATLISEDITGTIKDDDDGPVRAYIAAEQLVVQEGDIAQIPIKLSRNVSQRVTVAIATRPIAAIPGQDFYGFYRIITFEAGETQQTVPLVTLEDSIDEPVEELRVRLLNPGEGVEIDGSRGFSGEVPIMIRETQILPGELSVTGESCIEGESCDINVRLSRAYDAPVSVSLATRPISAIPGRDFYGFSNELTFSPGETAKLVSVTTLDNTVDEQDRSFEARIFTAIGAPIATPNTGPIIIRDND